MAELNLENEFAKVPELTLSLEEPEEKKEEKTEETAAGNTAAAVAVVEEEPEILPQVDDSMLSEQEKKVVEDFAKQIDITDSAMILKYGVGAQKKMADFSESALENVKSKELGEVGTMLSNVVTELKSFDATEESKGGFFGNLFKKETSKLDQMKAKYAKTEDNVAQICEALEGHQVTLMKDIAVLDKMYELNLTYYKELTMYILAGKKRLKDIRENELRELMTRARTTGKQEDAQAVRDLDAQCNRFEKKLHDLELTRTIALQTAPQIRLIQDNDTEMIEKIQSTIVNTIPLWKSQMVLALGVAHSGQAAKAERKVNDLTNELLKKNAETLKMASIETAKEAERGIVDMDTLRQTNQSLISTLDEVLHIQQEGHQQRMQAEVEMQKIEAELREKLIRLSTTPIEGEKK